MRFLSIIIFSYILVFIFVICLITVFYNKRRKQKVRKYLLRPKWFYKVFGWIILGLTFFPLVLIPNMDGEVGQEAFFALLMYLVVLSSSALYFLLLAINHRVWFDGEIIDVYDVSGRLSSIYWSEFLSAKYDPWSGCIIIRAQHKRLKVHLFMSKLEVFVEEMERHTNWTRNKLNIPKWYFNELLK